MYQSLHTTVIGPGGERVEFQIRTEEMHRIAEEGIAAHWKYKETGGYKGKDERYVAWLRDLVQSQKEDEVDARSFLEAVKSEVVPDVIYVFTPTGDVKELPEGSTPVDFAYAIHTEVGHRCVGARVNSRMVPLRHKLQSGNTVEVITSTSHKPSRDWLKFVVTQRAKARIKQLLKTEERAQSIELGKTLLDEEFKKHHISSTLFDSPEMTAVVEGYKLNNAEDLMAAVGYGKLSAHQVVNRLQPDREIVPSPTRTKQKPQEQRGIVIKGIDDVLYHTAKCCFPVPGDELTGFITRGKGVAVHRRGCHNLERLAVDEARLIDVEWTPNNDIVSYAKLYLDTMDKPGIIADLSAVISAAGVNISHLEASTSSQDRRARIILILEIKHKEQLMGIIHKLDQMDGVLGVKRL